MRVARSVAGLFANAAIAAVCMMLSLEVAVRLTPAPLLDRLGSTSVVVTGSDGDALFGFRSTDDKWRFAADRTRIDRRYLDLLLATEDRRFLSHRGVDFLALARSLMLNVSHGRVVSGGSTITMQLVRLAQPSPRTIGAKLREILQALKLERLRSKEQILDAYLTLAPFGGNIEGVRAASRIYFGKEPERLSLEEAALLVVLPQAPEARRPDRAPDQAKAARKRLLSRAAARGIVPEILAREAATRGLGLRGTSMPQNAPQLASRVLRARGHTDEIRTTIHYPLQLSLEAMAQRTLAAWEPGVNLAILVIRNSDGAVIGYVGSGDPFNAERKGYVDSIRSVRSPGSTLKPFIYAMAFERLIAHPDTVVADQPIDVAGYRPDNADGRFAGDISMRQALLLSKNTVPVLLMEKIGVASFMSRFRVAGSPLKLAAPDSQAGLAVALGGVGTTLEQLVWWYSSFPNGGALNPLRFLPADRQDSLGDLFKPAAAHAVADILADVPAPAGRSRLLARDGTRRAGFKTGTSYGFRDCWTIGFDRLHTVGIWIGRPDGSPLLGEYGVAVAAPLFHAVLDMLPVPDTGIGATSAQLGAMVSPRALPPRLLRFGPELSTNASASLRIEFPKAGAEIVARRGGDGMVMLPLRLSGGRPPFHWSIAGGDRGVASTNDFLVAVIQRGQIDIDVLDADGRSDRTSFWLE